MWVVALRSRGEFEGVREELEGAGGLKYERTTTGTGGEVLQSPVESQWPHLILVPDEPQRLQALAQWIHRHLSVTAVISSGLMNPCISDPPDVPSLIPLCCLRSAGRVDIGGGPVLYEEILFDRELQELLCARLHGSQSVPRGRLFCFDRQLTDMETKRWVLANLGAEGTDDFTANLLLVGRRFGTRVGCLKIFENAKDPIQSLTESWKTLMKMT